MKMKIVNFAILFLLVIIQPVFGEETTPPLTPSLTESYQTDLMTGAAVVNVPIVVPPGRRDIQPNLSLNYSSNSPNGICGVGWKLDLGSIQRSTKRGVPKYDSTDIFTAEINGASVELVHIGGADYRAKQEGAFLKFCYQDNSWLVQDKSGMTYYFGTSDNSRQYDSGRVFKWCLDRVQDVHGNYMLVNYLRHLNQLYPQTIEYTGAVDMAPANKVSFSYEPRSDFFFNYRPNFKVETARRLSTIEITASDSLARRYVFSYTQSPQTRRSLLSSITQFGSDGITSLPPITFEYQ